MAIETKQVISVQQHEQSNLDLLHQEKMHMTKRHPEAKTPRTHGKMSGCDRAGPGSIQQQKFPHNVLILTMFI